MSEDLNYNRIFANLLTDWLSLKFFKTYKVTKELPGSNNFIISQRNKEFTLSVYQLWDSKDNEISELEKNINQDLDTNHNENHIVWMPKKTELFLNQNKETIIKKVRQGVKGLEFGDYREIRIPIDITLSQTEEDGSYVAINGGLSKIWTKISSGVKGIYQLDGSNYGRLPSEKAEEKIIIEKIQEASKLLNVGEASFLTVDEYWPINTIKSTNNNDNKIILATANKDFDATNGPLIRKKIRKIFKYFSEQNIFSNNNYLKIVFLVNSSTHEDEVISSSLRGINPDFYKDIDLILSINSGTISILNKKDTFNLNND